MTTSVQRNLLATCIAVLITSHNSAIADTPDISWSLSGFDEPESVLPHPTKPLLYVSNINGTPVELNGKGYISLLADDGTFIRHVWVNGMDAPKGMAIDEKFLYVADMKRLHIIDHEKAEIVKTLTAENSVMLNDIAIDNKGDVYISDMLGGGLYRYSNDQLTPWISSDKIPHPNGLFFHNNELLMATWGEGLKDDFSTSELGGLFTVNTNDKSLTPIKGAQTLGNLDGLAAINDHLVVNDWMNGNVFSYKDQTSTLLFNAGKHAADISTKGSNLYVPVMFSKRIDVYDLKQKLSRK